MQRSTHSASNAAPQASTIGMDHACRVLHTSNAAPAAQSQTGSSTQVFGERTPSLMKCESAVSAAVRVRALTVAKRRGGMPTADRRLLGHCAPNALLTTSCPGRAKATATNVRAGNPTGQRSALSPASSFLVRYSQAQYVSVARAKSMLLSRKRPGLRVNSQGSRSFSCSPKSRFLLCSSFLRQALFVVFLCPMPSLTHEVDPHTRSSGDFAIFHDISEYGRGLVAGACVDLCTGTQCDQL